VSEESTGACAPIRRLWVYLAIGLLVTAGLLVACVGRGRGVGGPVEDMPPPPQNTPPPQSLLIPGETVEGELAPQESNRYIFATGAGGLATVEIWFRPATSSGPEAELEATLFGPDGDVLVEEAGTVTLPPYIVEQELPETGSYLLQLDALSGTPGRYTVLVTLSDERLLTRSEIYTGTLPGGGLPGGGDGSSGGWGFMWPSPRRAISGWYFRDPRNPAHNGLDIATALYDPLVAVAAGTVSFASSYGGYGNLVLIDHVDGWQSWYAHLSTIAVTPGQQVSQGETIGAAGSTGYSTGPHLHFELRHEGTPVDPLVYLR